MGLISKNKTWVDNENVLFTDINANYDTIYNEFNGNVDNNNIKPSAAIDVAKVSGTAVNLTSPQTLQSKTLVSPTITTSLIVNDVYSLGSLTGTVNVNPANGDRQFGTLTANTTLNVLAPTSNKVQTITLYIATGAGGFTLALTPNSPANLTWQDNVTPTFTSTASKLNVISLFYDGTNWWGLAAKFA